MLESANTYFRGGGWIEDRFRVSDSVTVVPGLRLDGSGMTDGAVVSPRVSAVVGLGRSTRLRAAAGLYTQSPGYEKLILSDYLVDQVNLDYERARHLTIGVEQDLPGGLTARVDLYHKRFDRLIVGQLETEAERQARVALYDYPPVLAVRDPDRPAGHEHARQRRRAAKPTAWTCTSRAEGRGSRDGCPTRWGRAP